MKVIAIFDIGKTNKKLFLFDEHYKIVREQADCFQETMDDEGHACEDLSLLTGWVRDCIAGLHAQQEFEVKAINFSAYGASFVHIGGDGAPVAPLYNYLKPYPAELQKKFYDSYGGEITFSMLTASPVLGSLNSGMQLYRIKEQRPELFEQIVCSLHLPQYCSYLLTGQKYSDITSIGCHTNLWNFSQHNYHEWVYREGIIDKLPPILPSVSVVPVEGPGGRLAAGIGLHDSSSAMIPYLESFQEPFVLISTGTWCISMNPFNDAPLTVAELQQDCLCYCSYQGRAVKASRLFAGYEHEQQVKRLAAHFHKAVPYAATVGFEPDIVSFLHNSGKGAPGGPAGGGALVKASVFAQRELADYTSFEQAYHRLIMDIMEQQVASTRLVLHGTEVKRIFVDGGFGRNQVYMHLLAAAFPHIEVFAASISQATAMGAALAIHPHWNSRPLPGDIIELKYYK